MRTFWCEWAWLPTGVASRVRLTVQDGRFRTVESDVAPGPGDERLRGFVLPGFANAHSHAFHRALRGRTHDGAGTFWTWRSRMYDVAAQLDPDSYLTLARAAYAEMSLAGVTCVGEFHYLHHAPGGRPYADPNEMAHALVRAGDDAGVRLTLLDTCYLAGGLGPDGHLPLDRTQLRFGDGDADRWAARVADLREGENVRVGAAVHSVRAVPAGAFDTVREAAAGRPLHTHLSEQPAENEACQAFYGRSPTALLAEHGLLTAATTAVHATHLSGKDIELLGGAGSAVCACPSTEADLADGVGEFRELHDAGSPLCLGSDQHALTDLLGETRLLEYGERLRSGRRGRFSQPQLLAALTAGGHRALGWPDAGSIAPGQRADLVAVTPDSARTAGTAPDQVLMAAAAPDVHTVVAGGRVVVAEGRHILGDVGPLLAHAIAPLWEQP